MTTVVKITNAINGWMLEFHLDEEQVVRYVFSYEDGPDGENEVNSFAGLLRQIDTLIGPSTSRYSEHRIYVDVRPGDKYSVISQQED